MSEENLEQEIQESNIDKVYDPKQVENKWYQTWMEKKCFTPTKGKNKKTFSVIMPPPNVTGRLHMGHALDHTCQDVLVRFKRMNGYRTLWIPGTDHAGIATQSVVEKKLYKEKKITKHEMGREKFVEEIWKWKDQYGDEIIDQCKKLGDSCDWDYLTFTMDEIPNRAVRKLFTKLFNEKLIYQAERIINWDTVLQSAISDAEVEHKEVKGHFYFIHYQVKNSNEKLLVATTRPETLFGDTAVAVNPHDDRFKHLIGKTVIIPLCNREVPIIGDEHVNVEVGTGCLKVTPGHDFNDFEIGKRHQLPIINIINNDGTFNKHAGPVEGLKTQKAREKTIQLLTEQEFLVETKDHVHQVGFGERSDSIIEPIVSKQWFLNVTELAARSCQAVEADEMKFIPKTWENTFFSWMREPKDWCLSRQLWWGHQIPVYTCGDCEHLWASEEEPTACPTCNSEKLTQDPDVLDTWFSSGIWPMSTLGWPDPKAMKEKYFNDFFPNSVLVTAYDIIFFWVARMLMTSLYLTDKSPFKETYIHGIVRDKQGRKMSKSLGNGIDPMELIEKYGCDAVRFTLAAGAGHNRGLNLDPERIEGYRNFINKLWNAFRFIEPSLSVADAKIKIDPKKLDIHEKWILGELNQVRADMNKSIEEYRFDEASSAIYSFVYDKFCSWFIELSKPILYGEDQAQKKSRANVLKFVLKDLLKLIHPITPFVSEEIWSFLNEDTLLISEDYPQPQAQLEFATETSLMNQLIEITTLIRNMRSSVNLKPKDEIKVHFFTDNKDIAQFLFHQKVALKQLAKVSGGFIKQKSADKPAKSISSATANVLICIPLEGVINIEDEINRIQKRINQTKEEIAKCDSKLSNQNFVSRAPENVINEVKENAQKMKDQLANLEVSLAQFQ